MPPLTRRSVLAGAAGALVLAACGGDDGETATTTSGPTTSGGTGTASPTGDLVLGEAFDRNALLVAEIPQRAAYLLFEASGGLVPPQDAPDALTFDITTEAGAAIESLEIARHGDDIDRAYYPLVTTFPAPGIYVVSSEAGGQPVESLVAVNAAADVVLPQVGAALPGPATPTLAAPLDTETICTHEPPCPFHEVSLDAAVGAAPVAFILSTPAYCNTAICGPVLEQLIEVAPSHPSLTVVHLEVYPYGAPPDGGPSPLVTDPFGMTYEPALFVADAAGTVTARLDNIWDGAELAAALATA